MAIITTPVTEPSQISSLLGISTTNYADIFTKGNINMWAKFKPVRSSTLHKLTDDDGNPSEELMLLNYGLSITEYDFGVSGWKETALNNAMSGNTGWIYERPRGLEYNEWFRGWDWVGYNSDAKCPFYLEDISIPGQLKIRIGQVATLPKNNMLITDIKGSIGLDNPDTTGYGILFRRNGGDIRQIEYDQDDKSNPIKYPITQDHEILISEIDGEYELCVYIQDSNRTGYVLLHPYGGIRIKVDPVPPIVKFSNVYVGRNSSGAKTQIVFTITGNNTSGSVSAGYAALRMYNDSGQEKEIFNYDIKSLSYNESITIDVIEDFNIDNENWAIFELSYQGVSYSGSIE